ncbi:hypothetical protein [Maricaulis salignorans]|uniref:hypothetical protein n=1 Tax=Maricaulis salignorans TaxID=144026 RepID=UPI003A906441
MAEISRALSAPVSTLYQWAARGQWRQADLMQAALPAAPELDAGQADNPVDEDAELPTALEAAQAVLQPTALEGARGQLVRSERARNWRGNYSCSPNRRCGSRRPRRRCTLSRSGCRKQKWSSCAMIFAASYSREIETCHSPERRAGARRPMSAFAGSSPAWPWHAPGIGPVRMIWADHMKVWTKFCLTPLSCGILRPRLRQKRAKCRVVAAFSANFTSIRCR